MKRLFLLTIAFVFLFSGTVCVLPVDGLVAYYALDGNAQDSSGNDRDGTEHNGITYVDGALGQGAYFDGSYDYIDVPDGLFPEVIVSAFISYGLDHVPANDRGYLTVSAVDGWSSVRENFKLTLEQVDGSVRFGGYFHEWGDQGDGTYKLYPETRILSGEAVQQDLFYHVATSYDGNTHK